MFKEFREFAMRGNVVDMAVGIVIGAAFTTVVRSLVDDVIMPPIGWATGGIDFTDYFLVLHEGEKAAGPYASLAAAKEAGAVTVDWGEFVNACVSFIIVAFALFLVVRGMNHLRRKEEEAPPEAPATKNCPYCIAKIPIQATRCPQCTSTLEE